jgi:uncharacterized protein YabE (DUF348 family)/3D (Asp-Asp-Asp) domain-containing protein
MFKEKIKGFKKSGFFQKRLFAIAVLSLFLAYAVSSVALSIRTVSVFDGENILRVQTMSNDPATVLGQAGVVISDYDAYSITDFNGKLSSITVSRAFDVLISADGSTHTVKMLDGSVEDAVNKAGIRIDPDDILSVSADSAVYGGMTIDVTRVNFNYVRREQTLSYASSVEHSNTLDRGVSRTITAGANGLKAVTVRQRIENGEVVNETHVSEEILRNPVNERKMVGTRESVSAAPAAPASGPARGSLFDPSNVYSNLQPPSPIRFDSSGRPIGYSQLIVGLATAYHFNPATSRTSTGRPPGVGYVAVNPRQIPYGTQLWIRTSCGSFIYGYAVAADTGGFANQGRITVDLFLNSVAECFAFGVREVEIFVLG